MPTDPRDVIWNDTYDLHYDTKYEEMLISALLTIWSRVDAVTKVLIALTASGSAIAGWALWKGSGYKELWAALTGTGMVLSIISTSLSVSTRLKEHAATKQKFSSLRAEIEILRHDMALNPGFDVAAADKTFVNLKRKYSEYLNGEQTDILIFRRLEDSVQKALNNSYNTANATNIDRNKGGAGS